MLVYLKFLVISIPAVIASLFLIIPNSFWSNQVEPPTQIAVSILDSILVDSVVADFPVGFDFVIRDGWQFVAYYDKGRNLKVASRKLPDKSWRYQTLPSRVGWDSHNRIVMAIDRTGKIHVSANMHNDTMIYFMTTQPYDISSFERVFPLVSTSDELRCTYPKFIRKASGELIFSYRKGGSGNGVTILNLFDEKQGEYRRLTDEPLFDGLGLMSAYPRGPLLGPDGYFHLIWFWRDTPGCETNHDLSYVRSRDLVRWESIDGRRTPLPITPETVHTTVDPVPPLGGAINGGAQLFFGPENQPMIAYMKYDSAGNSQIFLANFTGETWISRQISRWDYRWNFSGPGSIEFEIKVGQGYTDDDGDLCIPYDHVKRGTGVLTVDDLTLELIADQSVRPEVERVLPAELRIPQSGLDGASIKWLRLDRNATDYYILRWEAMGTRRFYKPPDHPVRPASLNLFLLSTADIH